MTITNSRAMKILETGFFEYQRVSITKATYLRLKNTCYQIWISSDSLTYGWIRERSNGLTVSVVTYTFDGVLQSVPSEIQEALLFNLDLFR